jgi:hypothetical protein
VQDGIPVVLMRQTKTEMITYDGSTASLLLQQGKVKTGEFALKSVISVQDSALTKNPSTPSFSPERDYQVDLQTGELTIPTGSAIPSGTKLAITYVYVNQIDLPFKWGARLMMCGLTVVCLYLIARAYKRGMIRDEVAPDLRS